MLDRIKSFLWRWRWFIGPPLYFWLYPRLDVSF